MENRRAAKLIMNSIFSFITEVAAPDNSNIAHHCTVTSSSTMNALLTSFATDMSVGKSYILLIYSLNDK